jgi:hypothetical protein
VVWSDSSESVPCIYLCLRLVVVVLTFLYSRGAQCVVLDFLCLRAVLVVVSSVSPLSAMIVSSVPSMSMSFVCILLYIYIYVCIVCICVKMYCL